MSNELDIAVVGMAGRFPGARDLDEFWRNLSKGVESITRFSDEELLQAGVPAAYLNNPDYVKAAPILEQPGEFDADFFGFLPAEARTLDPQHRILLELAHEALEDAGCDPGRYSGRIGVFTGSAFNTYFMDRGLSGQFAQEYIPTLIASDKDFLSTRISYKLNLKGPSLTIQTACSTSMVAVHLARQSLLNEECNMALAGAISVRVPNRAGYFCGGGGVVSPDGHVRPFDAQANGTVFGSGGGILALKRLSDALSDGDNIHAVIKGSAVNNDGAEKAGYTTPSVNGQADAVVEALANAGVEADSITYVEAHGSGTPVGDPVEIRALTKAFRAFTQRSGYCAIGSVKSNVGHLDAAAAVAGMIKTILALKHRLLPPSLHFSQPNPEIDFASTPFYVNTRLQEWRSDGPRRAGIMSTGMGGTNAHVVFEEAPEAEPVTRDRSANLLILSAKSPAALGHASHRLGEFLERNESVNMNDVAHTLRMGRRSFAHRCCLVAASRDDALAALAEQDSRRVLSSLTQESGAGVRPVAFLFPGIGDHYVGMAHGLYEEWDVFRQEVDRCAQILDIYMGTDIRKILYPAGQPWRNESKSKGIDLKKMLGRTANAPLDSHAEKLNQTLFAQPALFTLEYSLARLWQALGITPAAMVGHSMGEYVAACLAGVLSLEDALRLIAVRARLVNELPQGAMLAVNLSEKELHPLLPGELSISLINGPALCVVAGPAEAVNEFERRLPGNNIMSRRVQNAHAFHSRMLSPILSAFENEARKVRLNEPAVPYISNVTGRWITAREATDPSYWAMHAVQTARFSDALQELWRLKDPILLEAGPGRTLGVLAMQHPDRLNSADPVSISTVRHHYENQSDVEFLLQGIGRLWLAGVEIRWEGMYPGDKPHRVSLPTYPFERQNYWIDSSSAANVESRPASVPGKAAAEPLPESQTSSLADWFYTPSWKRTQFPDELVDTSGAKPALWLVIGDRHGGGSRIKARLEAAGLPVVFARFGQTSARNTDGSWDINPAGIEGYRELFLELERRTAGAPIHVVHLGSLIQEGEDASPLGSFSLCQDFGFFSLLHTAQAIGELRTPVSIKIGILSNRLQSVTGEEDIAPAMSTVLGPCGVIPREYPNIQCFNLDLPDSKPIDSLPEELLGKIISEFAGDKDENEASPIVAYRGQFRWERTLEQIRVKEPQGGTAADNSAAFGRLRPGGVYLITGGTGGIGLAIANYLAKACRPRLVLTRRSPFPERSTWTELIAVPDTPASMRKTITALIEIEKAGAEIDVVEADVSDRRQMQTTVEEILTKYGTINGVIHSAGVVQAALIQAKTRAAAECVMAPKVKGAMILYELLLPVKPDFLVLFSSTASILTPAAECDYSAANCFLDAFSSFANSHGGFHTLTINWPGWKDVGMLAELSVPAGLEGWKQAALEKSITPQDGVEVFHRVLHSNLAQVIVSPENPANLLKAIQSARGVSQAVRSQPSVSTGEETGHLANPVEAALGEIWKSVLGLERIGIHENFLSLGGHSFLAMQIVAKIRSRYPIPFTLKDFFEGPTIAEISAVIQARILAEIENLTDEQVRRLLLEM
jgi:acyl transferase domain-containing protein